ncbi:hypothetical protein [Nocardioides sp. L-11A]|uniref:hypothetical protein n=1 Tax=Nocardioides sp. L-11A TaxID=3043848 RepID=UPI00249C3C15|nr:hypothetical protein QJ852_17030 [Nocardioides sp. L-11A]
MTHKFRLRRPAVGLAALAAAVGTVGLVGVATGPAQADVLPPVLEKFANCPVQNPDVSSCYYIETNYTSLKAGSFDEMTSTDPIILQFGAIPDLFNQTSIEVPPANGAPVLQASPIELPGGILGIPGGGVGPLQAFITPEIVGLPELNLDNLTTPTDAPVMELNLKAKISNPFTDALTVLGTKCTIGSNSSPIALKLTTGTTNPPAPNTPISGVPGTFDFSDIGSGVIKVTGQTVVDNAWALPKAANCGLTGALNGIIDIASGQANAGPGHNSALLKTTIYQASAYDVRWALAAAGNQVADAGFEDAGMGPWECVRQCGVDHGLGNARTGTGNGWVRNTENWNDIHQTISVAPNTDYTLTGWVRTSASNDNGYFGVRTLDDSVISEKKFGRLNSYTQLSVSFNSGDRTRVEVYGGVHPTWWRDTWAQFDDFSVTAN